MATTLLLHTARPSAELPVSRFHGKGMYTMPQSPSLGGLRSIGVSRRGYGVLKRKTVLLGFRAQGGRFTLPGTKKVKKETPSSGSEPEMPTGTRKLRKLPGTLKLDKGKKDNNVVFVAGATGKVGSRTVRELLKLGFQVRAGVRDITRGQALLEIADKVGMQDKEPLSWTAKLFRFRAPPQQDGLELVECDLERADEIEEALGDAGVVVCTIGASEKEVLDVTGPYRIDFKACKNLIEAATSAKVNHLILVTSLGTTKFGWPASVLNLFWGVLIWKAKAEKALEESGLPYTIVRPGGMEKPTDAYKETHNLILYPKDSLSGGQVSSLQVAELIACCVSNLDTVRYKVLEAVAETTAPLRPIEDLLSELPSEDRGSTSTKFEEDRRTLQNSTGSRPQEEKKLSQAEEKKKLAKRSQAEEKEKKALQAQYESKLLAAREKEEDAKRAAEEASSQQQELERRMAELQMQVRAAEKAAKTAKALETALKSAARQGRRLSDKEKKEIVDAVNAEFAGEAKTEEKEKVQQKPKTEPAVSKAEKNLKMKAEKVAKVKEAEDKATKASAEEERLAKEEAERKEKEKEAQVLKGKAKEERLVKEEAERKEKEEEAEALKAKAEEESKRKAATEAAERAEEERIAKEESAIAVKEAEAKAFVEAKEQAERERIAKEEAARKEEAAKEIQVKAAAEAAENAEREEKKKIAAEAAVREREALQKAKPAKTFRWPWQKESVAEIEPAQPVAANSEGQPSATSPANGGVKANADMPPPPSPQPLSPYARYPGLKPPTSPIPRPPQGIKAKSESVKTAEKSPAVTEQAPKIIEEVATSVVEVAENTEEAIRENAKKAKEEAAARAALALEKARSATSFRWPWQKSEETKEEDGSLLTSGGNKEDVPLTKVEIASSESSAAPPVPSSPESLPPPSRPLSPYTRYPGLKPPTSPIPRPPQVLKTTSEAVETPEVLSTIEEKVPKIAKEVVSSVEEVVENTEEALKEKAKKAKEEAVARAALAVEKARGVTSLPFRWPWQQEGKTKLDDAPVQEPPLPSANVESSVSSEALEEEKTKLDGTPADAESSVSSEAPPVTADSTSLPRPLSPYTRYTGLRPPASPTPLPPEAMEVKGEESTETTDNGAGAQEQEAAPEQELETASAATGFKWPWQA